MVRAIRSLLEEGARASGRASSVVNVSSASVFDGGGSSIAYTASKAALVAEVVMFLAGPASRHVTGEMTVADAGWLLARR